MFSIGVQGTVEELGRVFGEMGRDHIPFATSLALNRSAALARRDLKTQLPAIFDRPTPYTMNSIYTKNSTKRNLEARVEHKEFAGKGTPASKYLRPEIEGGTRGQKRSEAAFGRLAGMTRAFWVPGPGARLNAYGNVTGAAITQMLSAVGGLGEQGYQGNRTARSAKRKGKRLRQFFVMPANNPRGAAPGVYERKAGKVVPVLWLIPRASYKPRYDMKGIVYGTVQKNFGAEFVKAMDFALATAFKR